MSYDKNVDLKSIQADVLTTDTSSNEQINTMKVENKVVTKAINALNEQLGNAQTSAGDAMERMVKLRTAVQLLHEKAVGQCDENGVHVVGMVLTNDNTAKKDAWLRVNRYFQPVEFDPNHGTWAGMKTVVNSYGEFVEIPVTWVKTERLTTGPYFSKNCWWIADGPVDGFHVHPAFIGPDGQPHNLQIASWLTSSKDGHLFSENCGTKYDDYLRISYKELHNMIFSTAMMRPYSIYDHHFLARMMLVEFGAPDVKDEFVIDDSLDDDNDLHTDYHGMHDLSGTPRKYWQATSWIDGLTTTDGTYHLPAANGLRNTVDTGIACPDEDKIWPSNCIISKVNDVDFGDVFIAYVPNTYEHNVESWCKFKTSQSLVSNKVFLTNYTNPTNCTNPFTLNCIDIDDSTITQNFRLVMHSQDNQVIHSQDDQNDVNQKQIIGMVLTQEGNSVGTWVRVNENFETVTSHGTLVNMMQVHDDVYGDFVEIPVTYVKTETLTDGPYAGKNCWWTANYPAEDFHVHPAFIGSDGQPHNLQIASYIASTKNNVPFSEDKGVNAMYDNYWSNISYDTMHSMSLPNGLQPYSVYAHHLLARLMLTEYGTPNVQIDGTRVNYHEIYDIFGNNYIWCWLDGLSTLNGTWHVLAADGSRSMIDTGVACLTDGGWPINCLITKANGIDFGDLFIASSVGNENSGSFADYQSIATDCAFYVNNASSNNMYGAFQFSSISPATEFFMLGWRFMRFS